MNRIVVRQAPTLSVAAKGVPDLCIPDNNPFMPRHAFQFFCGETSVPKTREALERLLELADAQPNCYLGPGHDLRTFVARRDLALAPNAARVPWFNPVDSLRPGGDTITLEEYLATLQH
jgi:hypothetical protein